MNFFIRLSIPFAGNVRIIKIMNRYLSEMIILILTKLIKNDIVHDISFQ